MVEGIIIIVIVLAVVGVVKHLSKANRQGNSCVGCSCAGSCSGNCGSVSGYGEAVKR